MELGCPKQDGQIAVLIFWFHPHESMCIQKEGFLNHNRQIPLH